MVGTLVDLMPEALLLTEIALHPSVFGTRRTLGKMLKLVCSDGKPIVAFAAQHHRPESEPLAAVQHSLRRRLAAVAASFSMRDQCVGEYTTR